MQIHSKFPTNQPAKTNALMMNIFSNCIRTNYKPTTNPLVSSMIIGKCC